MEFILSAVVLWWKRKDLYLNSVSFDEMWTLARICEFKIILQDYKERCHLYSLIKNLVFAPVADSQVTSYVHKSCGK